MEKRLSKTPASWINEMLCFRFLGIAEQEAVLTAEVKILSEKIALTEQQSYHLQHLVEAMQLLLDHSPQASEQALNETNITRLLTGDLQAGEQLISSFGYKEKSQRPALNLSIKGFADWFVSLNKAQQQSINELQQKPYYMALG